MDDWGKLQIKHFSVTQEHSTDVARPEAHGKCRLFAAAAAADAFQGASGTVGGHHLENR